MFALFHLFQCCSLCLTQIVLLFLVLDKILLKLFRIFLPDSKFKTSDSLAVIISMYRKDFDVGAKFGPNVNKKVT